MLCKSTSRPYDDALVARIAKHITESVVTNSKEVRGHLTNILVCVLPHCFLCVDR